ncbi:BrnT family toxin [soil metagenome]
MFTWDEAKRRRNIAERGIDFVLAEELNLDLAVIVVDDRHDYGEVREVALDNIGGRIHVLVFTRRGDDIHIISLRKANVREIRRYQQAGHDVADGEQAG